MVTPSHHSSPKSLTSDNILHFCKNKLNTFRQQIFAWWPFGPFPYIWMFLPGSHSDPEASAELWWVRSHLTWEQPIRGTGAGAGGGGGRGAGSGGGGGGARGEAQVEPEAEECLWGVHLQKDQSRWESSQSKFFPPLAAWINHNCWNSLSPTGRTLQSQSLRI